GLVGAGGTSRWQEPPAIAEAGALLAPCVRRRRSQMPCVDRHRGGAALLALPRKVGRRRRAGHTAAALETRPLAGASQDQGDEAVELAGPADGRARHSPGDGRRGVEDERWPETDDGVHRRLGPFAGGLSLVDGEALEQPARRL